MRYLELCTLSESQINDLLGLMKELNADLMVTPQMQQRAVGASGTRIFVAENDEKHKRLLHVGFFELTDLVMNTVGAFVGALISVGVRKVVGREAGRFSEVG